MSVFYTHIRYCSIIWHEHPLMAQPILKITDGEYYIQIDRVSGQYCIKILDFCKIKANQQRIQYKNYYRDDFCQMLPSDSRLILLATLKAGLRRHNIDSCS